MEMPVFNQDLDLETFYRLSQQMETVDEVKPKKFQALDFDVPEYIQNVYSHMFDYMCRILIDKRDNDPYDDQSDDTITRWVNTCLYIAGGCLSDLIVDDYLKENLETNDIDIFIDDFFFEHLLEAADLDRQDFLQAMFDHQLNIVASTDKEIASSDHSSGYKYDEVEWVLKTNLNDLNIDFIFVTDPEPVKNFDFFLRCFFYDGYHIYGHHKGLEEIKTQQLTVQNLSDPFNTFLRFIRFHEQLHFHMDPAYQFLLISEMFKLLVEKDVIDSKMFQPGSLYVTVSIGQKRCKRYESSLCQYLKQIYGFEEELEEDIKVSIRHFLEAHNNKHHSLHHLVKLYNRLPVAELNLYTISETFQFFLDNKMYNFIDKQFKITDFAFDYDDFIKNARGKMDLLCGFSDEELLKLLENYQFQRIFSNDTVNFDKYVHDLDHKVEHPFQMPGVVQEEISYYVDVLSYPNDNPTPETVVEWLLNSATQKYNELLPIYSDEIIISLQLAELNKFLWSQSFKLNIYFVDPYKLNKRPDLSSLIDEDISTPQMIFSLLYKMDGYYYLHLNVNSQNNYCDGSRLAKIDDYFKKLLGDQYGGIRDELVIWD